MSRATCSGTYSTGSSILRSLPRVVWIKLRLAFHDFARLAICHLLRSASWRESQSQRGEAQQPFKGAGHGGPAPFLLCRHDYKSRLVIGTMCELMDLRINQFFRANQSKPRYIAKGLLLALS